MGGAPGRARRPSPSSSTTSASRRCSPAAIPAIRPPRRTRAPPRTCSTGWLAAHGGERPAAVRAGGRVAFMTNPRQHEQVTPRRLRGRSASAAPPSASAPAWSARRAGPAAAAAAPRRDPRRTDRAARRHDARRRRHAEPIPFRRPSPSPTPAAERRVPRAAASAGPRAAAPSRPARRPARAGAGRARRRARRRRIRRIQPEPPAPPAAPAGALDDETERPIGIRRVRRPARPIVTPPGDTPGRPRARGGASRRAVACSALLGARRAGVRRHRHAAALPAVRQRARARTSRSRSRRARAPARSATQLAEPGVVDSAFFFRVRATLSGKRDSLRSGPPHAAQGHDLRRRDRRAQRAGHAARSARRSTSRSPRAARAARSRRSPRRPGCAAATSRPPSASAARSNPFRYGAPRGTRSLEGFLFPATYELNVGAPARDLVERQLAAFRENFASVDLEPRASART